MRIGCRRYSPDERRKYIYSGNPRNIKFSGLFLFMNEKFMEEAIKAAENGKGNVYPNPMVGCVIVKNEKIIARGWHERFGGEHAEINALLNAGKKAKDAELYVTLEPCNSYGKRPPCTRAIIEAGIKRVFFAVKDPNVCASAETLQKNGIEVHSGLLRSEAKRLIKDYLLHLKKKNRVTVKAAMTLDGKIATVKYDSKWISCAKSRNSVHSLRASYDAVLAGTNTVLKDNPHLTSHSKGRNPVRVIIDSALKIPLRYNVFDASAPTVIVYDRKKGKLPAPLQKPGIIPAPVNMKAAKKDFKVIIEKLNSLSLKTILIEGGGNIISSALFSGAVDDIILFIAPKIAGGAKAVSVAGGKGVGKISEALRVKNMKFGKLGPDFVVTGRIENKR